MLQKMDITWTEHITSAFKVWCGWLTAQTSIREDISRMANGILSISEEVGILSASCFSRFFRELFKPTPTQHLVIVIAIIQKHQNALMERTRRANAAWDVHATWIHLRLSKHQRQWKSLTAPPILWYLAAVYESAK